MLAEVTNALVRLLEINVLRLHGTAVDVTKLPPESADDVSGTQLNLYLYHAAHDGDGGMDIPIVRNALRPISTRPLALKLYYVMTAHAGIQQNAPPDIDGQQSLMGYGMKTFHDYSVIADDTLVGVTPLFTLTHPLGSRNIEIMLRPVTPEETVSFWSTDQVRTARFAAYYEIRTVLLPPEEETLSAGPVANMALAVRGSGPPVLEGSQSEQSFTMPSALGGDVMTYTRRPAIAALRSGVPPVSADISIAGRAFGTGLDAKFVLRSQLLAGGTAVFSANDNAGWNIGVTDSGIFMKINPALNVIQGGAVTGITLLPGLYSFALRREITTKTDDGKVQRTVDSESNQIPIAIGPHVTDVSVQLAEDAAAVPPVPAPAIVAVPYTPANMPAAVIVTVDAAYDATDAAAEAAFSAAGEAYQFVDGFTGDAAADAGTFIAHDDHTYIAIALFDASLAGQTYQVKLSVNGVDSQPIWLETS